MKNKIQPRKFRQVFRSGLVETAPMRWLVCLVLVILTSIVLSVQAGLSYSDQNTYAQRFRPYIKTTLQNGPGSATEPHHPCNWQWLVGHSALVTNYVPYFDPHCCHPDSTFPFPITCEGINDVWPDGTIVLFSQDLALNPARLIQMPYSDVRGITNGVPNGAIDLRYALHLDSDRTGEAWTDVVHAGHGIYAHVEEVPNTGGNIINIEYTILWAYNEATCSYHHGDITTITVVYDRGRDLLTRITYDMHGRFMQTFRVAKPDSIYLTTFYERDINNAPTSIVVAHLYIAESDQYLNNGGDNFYKPANREMFLAPDPVTGRYEHPAGFAEYGSHELWPNLYGSVFTAPAHWGDGICFLPDTVQVLGTLTDPDTNQIPFLFYNGKMGTDPQGIILHNAWFWPDGRAYNPYGITRFTDDDPYQPQSNMPWPPAPEPAGPSVTVYVKLGAGPPYYGSAANPFPDLMTAFSFLPKGATLLARAGFYFGCGTVSRPCTIVATGGPVTLVGPGMNCQ